MLALTLSLAMCGYPAPKLNKPTPPPAIQVGDYVRWVATGGVFVVTKVVGKGEYKTRYCGLVGKERSWEWRPTFYDFEVEFYSRPNR